MVAFPGHILENTKGILIKLGTHIDENKRSTEDKNIILSYILFELSIFKTIIKVVFFVMSWCTVVFDHKFCLL